MRTTGIWTWLKSQLKVFRLQAYKSKDCVQKYLKVSSQWDGWISHQPPNSVDAARRRWGIPQPWQINSFLLLTSNTSLQRQQGSIEMPKSTERTRAKPFFQTLALKFLEFWFDAKESTFYNEMKSLYFIIFCNDSKDSKNGWNPKLLSTYFYFPHNKRENAFWRVAKSSHWNSL